MVKCWNLGKWSIFCHSILICSYSASHYTSEILPFCSVSFALRIRSNERTHTLPKHLISGPKQRHCQRDIYWISPHFGCKHTENRLNLTRRGQSSHHAETRIKSNAVIIQKWPTYIDDVDISTTYPRFFNFLGLPHFVPVFKLFTSPVRCPESWPSTHKNNKTGNFVFDLKLSGLFVHFVAFFLLTRASFLQDWTQLHSLWNLLCSLVARMPLSRFEVLLKVLVGKLWIYQWTMAGHIFVSTNRKWASADEYWTIYCAALSTHLPASLGMRVLFLLMRSWLSHTHPH